MLEFEWLNHLSFAEGTEMLRPALIFAVSVAAFGIVIFHMYRFMARRNPFIFDISGLRRRSRPLHILLYGLISLLSFVLVLPIFVYMWFWVMVVVLAFLYNSMEPQEILLMAMAVLTAIRVTAYYSEDLARDIAKILPYGLLGIFVISLGQFDMDKSFVLIESIADEGRSAFYFWLYIVGQEFVLRVTYPVVTAAVRSLVTAYNSLRGRPAGDPSGDGSSEADSPGDISGASPEPEG